MVAVALAFASGILKWFLETTIGRIVGGLLLAAVALSLYTVVIQRNARAEILAHELALTKAESERRQKVIADAQEKARQASAVLQQEDKTNDDLVSQIDALSKSGDGTVCLDAASVGRLQQLGQPSGQGTGSGARSPAR